MPLQCQLEKYFQNGSRSTHIIIIFAFWAPPVAILAPNMTKAALSGHNSEPNLWPLSALHTKHSRAVRSQGGVDGCSRQRRGAEALRDNESRVDAFHTFRRLFITRRLHTKLTADLSRVSITDFTNMKRCCERHRVVNSLAG